MIAQGSVLANTAVLDRLIDRVNAVNSCAALTALSADIQAECTALSASITAEVALLAPMLALLTAPTDLTKLITWVGSFITSFLTPYVRPYALYAAQLTALTTKIAQLSAAVASKAATFNGCTVTAPTFP